MLKRIAWILIYALIAYTAYAGIWNGYQDWRHSIPFCEKVVAGLTIMYGIAAIVALPALLLKKSWAFLATALWAGLCTCCAISAIVVYTEEGLWPALAGGITGLFGIFIPLLLFVRKNLF